MIAPDLLRVCWHQPWGFFLPFIGEAEHLCHICSLHILLSDFRVDKRRRGAPNAPAGLCARAPIPEAASGVPGPGSLTATDSERLQPTDDVGGVRW